MTTSGSRINIFHHWCNLNPSSNGSRETQHKKKITLETLGEDPQKGYVITVADAHMVEQQSDKEWYLPHQRVINQN